MLDMGRIDFRLLRELVSNKQATPGKLILKTLGSISAHHFISTLRAQEQAIPKHQYSHRWGRWSALLSRDFILESKLKKKVYCH